MVSALRFKVQFRRQIHSCFAAWSSNNVYVSIEDELPFPPFLGLTYEKGNVQIEVRDDPRGERFDDGSHQRPGERGRPIGQNLFPFPHLVHGSNSLTGRREQASLRCKARTRTTVSGGGGNRTRVFSIGRILLAVVYLKEHLTWF